MIFLIGGASHAGKTVLAQKLLESYHYPYLSIDHLKMGLIRSHQTELTPEDDGLLTVYLWPIVREIIKTAIENQQNLIVEGMYIPFQWQQDFEAEYLKHIKYQCLILSESYIRHHFDAVKAHANDVEFRQDDSCLNAADLLAENAYHLEMCHKYHLPYILVEDNYEIDGEIFA